MFSIIKKHKYRLFTLLIIIIIWISPYPSKPLKNLGDVAAIIAYHRVYENSEFINKALLIEEQEEIRLILAEFKNIITYNRSCYLFTSGRFVKYSLIADKGEILNIEVYDSHICINGNYYKASNTSCDRLNNLAFKILQF